MNVDRAKYGTLDHVYLSYFRDRGITGCKADWRQVARDGWIGIVVWILAVILALAFAGLGWFFLCALPTLDGFCLSLPLAGDAAKQLDNIIDAIKLANKIPTSPFSAKIDNCAERLTMKDLIGAARELKGEVVKRKASGVPWDHVDEAHNAQGFLLNQIAAINRKLAHPGTDAAMRNLFVADLGAPAEC
ncbi:polymorphic toxin type 28 domain-containing protein [Streptomyces sp. CLV115]|uniref:polymorphic toxin type 28 domain-containing protein n=1 Tax=Streptomyces sp. CLV115 TaxID=3138502 RepID=UPI00313DB144